MDQSPDQIKKIKQAQRTLWVGIFLIVFAGLLVAVYFVFVSPVGEVQNTNLSNVSENANNTNAVSNTNTLININTTSLRTVNIHNGSVTIQCKSGSDCTLVDDTVDLGICCGTPVCSSYAESKYVAVNAESLRQLTIEAQANKCESTLCPQYLLAPCNPEGTEYKSECIANECAKVPISG